MWVDVWTSSSKNFSTKSKVIFSEVSPGLRTVRGRRHSRIRPKMSHSLFGGGRRAGIASPQRKELSPKRTRNCSSDHDEALNPAATEIVKRVGSRNRV